MTEYSTSENDGRQSDLMKNVHEDYAEQYRPNIARFNGSLRSVARFGLSHNETPQETAIPTTFQDHRFIGPMISYINDPGTKFKTAAAKYRRAFDLILEVACENPELDWRYFGSVLLKKLKTEEKSEHRIKTNHDAARLLFVRAADASSDHRLQLDIRRIAGLSSGHREYVGNWPALRNPPSTPNRSLEEVFGDDLGYSNDQYVSAISEYAASFIMTWSSVRRRLREEYPELFERIVNTIKSYGLASLNEIEAQQVYSYKTKIIRDDWLKLLSMNLEILECLDEPLLNTIAVSQHGGQQGFLELIATADIVRKGVSGYAQLFQYETESGLAPRTRWVDLREGRKIKSLNSRILFSLLDFVGPTIEEEICFRWLLASWRIQPSNVDRMKRSNINEDAKLLWIRSYKGRNKKAQPLSVNKNSKEGRAIRSFIKDYDSYGICKSETDFLVGRYKPSYGRFLGTCNFCHLLYPGNPEGLEGHGLSKHGLTIIKDIYANIRVNNHKIGRADNHGDGKKPTVKALHPSFVCQSHVYAEEAKRGTFRKSPSMKSSHEIENASAYDLNARRQFHEPETRENIYRGRSRDKIQLRKGERFAAAVSDEMAIIAGEIIEAWEENTSSHSVSELIDIIGLRGFSLEAPPETFLAAAKAEKFVIEKSGLITRSGKTYLFDSGLTARMMMEEVRSIEGQLERLFTTQDSDRAINAWAKYCFLEILLTRFSSASLRDARQKYGHLENNIPHAPISEGGNSWIVK